MKRRHLSIALLTITLIVIVSTPYLVLGVNGYGNVINVSPNVVWETFMDYLQGKSVGIVKINVVPVNGTGSPVKGTFMVRVHNFTDYHLKPHSEIIYRGNELSFSFEIGRMPLRYDVPEGEDQPRIVYKEYEYTIFVIENELGLGGGKLVRFEPVKPLTELTVMVEVNPLKATDNSSGAKLQQEGGPVILQPEEVQYTQTWMEAVQLHTIPGISSRFYARAGNYLYYTQKHRYLDMWGNPSTDWRSDGDKVTRAQDTAWGPEVSNGAKKWAIVYVTYRYERWWVGAPEVWWHEIVTPVSFGGRGLGGNIACSTCGGNPVGLKLPYEEGSGGIAIPLGPGFYKEEKFGIGVSFEVSYGHISLTVELWYEISIGESFAAPEIQVTVNTWYKHWLIGFDANTNWKVVHWTWRDTWP